MPESPPFILDLTRDNLTEILEGWGEPAYRAKQIYRSVHVKLAQGPEHMTDLPRKLRERLAEEIAWCNLDLQKSFACDNGDTRKALFVLPDGSPVEAVIMAYSGRSTACVSSQSGCLMRCSFCATGRMGLLANLSSGQIIEQVLWAERELREIHPDAFSLNRPRLLTNLVFMGMGEAFNNYDAWWAAVERLHDPEGFNLGARGMTVSTVGLVPGIRRLAEATLPINLAISLHASNDELRGELMPINKAYPIAELMSATKDYIERTNRRVSFEYILLQDKNDGPEHADELAGLLNRQYPAGEMILFHVNLIPWNPIPGTPLTRSHHDRVKAFQRILEKHGVPCTIRVERGTSIAAACGQLAGGN